MKKLFIIYIAATIMVCLHANIISFEGDLELDKIENHLKDIYRELTDRKAAMSLKTFEPGNKVKCIELFNS